MVKHLKKSQTNKDLPTKKPLQKTVRKTFLNSLNPFVTKWLYEVELAHIFSNSPGLHGCFYTLVFFCNLIYFSNKNADFTPDRVYL